MREDKNVVSLVKDGLCTGCGTCVGVCPLSALKMVKDEPKGIYVPRLNSKKCNRCGICLTVCPGHSVDFKQLNICFFGKEPENAFLGNYLNCYIGYSSDYKIRYKSSSGGLVTALLIFALEEGLIDGALVTRMSRNDPLEPQPFIARSRDEIITASKSKYCPVPANIAIKEILEAEEGKFAIVGLPCHIWGVRKAELSNKELKDKIILHFGLFCSHVPSFLATEFILNRIGVRKEDIAELSYRGEGWPGYMCITLAHPKQTLIRLNYMDYYSSGFGSFLFWPTRCTLCPDALAELADISFGDAWLPELMVDKIGTSMVISRSIIGDRLLDNAQEKGRIELSAINEEDIIRAQQGSLRFKKEFLSARIHLYKLITRKVPAYTTKLSKASLAAYLSAIWCYSLLHLGRRIVTKKHLI
jgi:coenzyme F420 hydrogenase subunit beta